MYKIAARRDADVQIDQESYLPEDMCGASACTVGAGRGQGGAGPASERVVRRSAGQWCSHVHRWQPQHLTDFHRPPKR